MATSEIKKRPLSAKARFEKVVAALFQVPRDEIAKALKAKKNGKAVK